MTSFTLLTLSISYIVKIIPFDPDSLRIFAVIIIGFLGFTLLIPQLSQILEGYVSRISGKAGGNKNRSGFVGGYITGFSLGIVWSPCAGPILATIATLAATQAVSANVVLVTVIYVIGVGIPLFLFAVLGQRIFSKSKSLSPYTGRIQQAFGLIMILTAIAIGTGYDRTLQTKLLDVFPSYSNFLYSLESNQAVKKQLDSLKGQRGAVLNLGKAPEFIGITHWLNSEPLTLAQLKGKVVLVDFWTYTCINCIRTLPYVTGWYEKYKDKGFIVIGIHTPEFEFEKKTTNVEKAIKEYNIHYPVGQDNDYATWKAYNNQYWPAKYLIDVQGNLRLTHFGEGQYEETEKAIQELLKEAGQTTGSSYVPLQEQTPQGRLTPETYLGTARIDRFASPESIQNGAHVYTSPRDIPEDNIAFTGTWDGSPEYSISGNNASLSLRFIGNKVFLVMMPRDEKSEVKVYLDGKLISGENAGADVRNGLVQFSTNDFKERLYDLVHLKNDGQYHLLKLEFVTPGTKLFAFTFG